MLKSCLPDAFSQFFLLRLKIFCPGEPWEEEVSKARCHIRTANISLLSRFTDSPRVRGRWNAVGACWLSIPLRHAWVACIMHVLGCRAESEVSHASSWRGCIRIRMLLSPFGDREPGLWVSKPSIFFFLLPRANIPPIPPSPKRLEVRGGGTS